MPISILSNGFGGVLVIVSLSCTKCFKYDTLAAITAKESDDTLMARVALRDGDALRLLADRYAEIRAFWQRVGIEPTAEDASSDAP